MALALTFLATSAVRGQGERAPVDFALVAGEVPALHPGDAGRSGSPGPTGPAAWGPCATLAESLWGDAYAEGRWRPTPLATFFREGWLSPWAAGPAGRHGLTPRQGWLGAFDGLFFRLWLTTFSDTRGLNTAYRGERFSGSYAIFLPVNRRFEVLIDVPFVVSNGTSRPGRGYTSRFGDLAITPRFLLAESEATTHVFVMDVRMPTGSAATGDGRMALVPRYSFWTNPVGPWVVRGAASVAVPLDQADVPARTSFVGGLAAGRYFTPHNAPFGDLVLYVACNLTTPIDGGPARETVVGVGPGTRFHLGRDWYFLHFWDFPVTGGGPDDHTMQVALLKVF